VTISAVGVSTLPTGRATNFDKLHKDLILINWCIMNGLKKSMRQLPGEADKSIPQIKKGQII